MNDLTGMVIGMLENGGMAQLSSQLGTDQVSTQKAVSTAVPVLLSALGKNASRPQGAEALLDAIRRDHDGSILDKVDAALNSGALDKDGTAILSHVLGDKTESVATRIGQVSGLTTDNTSQLLAMLAPLIMGGPGKAQRQGGLDAIGLASLLSGERKQAKADMGGLAGLLDMDGDGDITNDVMKIESKLLGSMFGR